MLLDMHVHSTFSDGKKDIYDIANEASKKGIQILSVTDHNVCKYFYSINDIYNKTGIRIIPGIELSANIKGILDAKSEYIHILGINIKNVDIIEEKMNDILLKNKYRYEDQLVKFGLSRNEALENSKNGIITKKTIIRTLMIKESKDELYIRQKYFSKGSKYNIPKEYLDLKDAIDLLKKSGAYIFLAHPFRPRFEDLEYTVNRLKYEFGVDGLEVYYKPYFCSLSKLERVYFLENLANKYNMLMSAGSDCHFKGNRNEMGINIDILKIDHLTELF